MNGVEFNSIEKCIYDNKKCMFVIFCFYCYVLVIVNVLMFGIVDKINGFFYM